ncbi:phosphonate C-P lyase system protein PhnG [Noviherbaspirillum sp. Root189]|uniref:phosphonate C-P lyase system protein PhnG n=1 Tax=Noviherbaspirillum sp. Root189 TaxID=1736487 RepID=UPI00070FA065|nr:phosphonate C-P lyase system protein PhnG [Noviherbaspirillum sp. Root189]KRB93133.1 hypothetical protein ASE07_14295 [Noviherbaspirillum sp. Root189]
MKTLDATSDRARWMSLLAKAPRNTLMDAATQYGPLPEFLWMRKPETGLAMVRARAGGTGMQFNQGEMTITRCAVRLVSGETGIAYIAGRDKRHAELAAIFDALMQSNARNNVRSLVLDKVERKIAEQRQAARARAQATKVEFMTMVRGED